MMTTQHVSVAKTHTNMAHAAMRQGLMLSRRTWFGLSPVCLGDAKYPIVGAGGDRSL